MVSWTTGGPKRWAIAHNLALSVRQNAPQLERLEPEPTSSQPKTVLGWAMGWALIMSRLCWAAVLCPRSCPLQEPHGSEAFLVIHLFLAFVCCCSLSWTAKRGLCGGLSLINPEVGLIKGLFWAYPGIAPEGSMLLLSIRESDPQVFH